MNKSSADNLAIMGSEFSQYLINSSFIEIGYTKVAVDKSCKDCYLWTGYTDTLGICADKCFETSTVFVYGKTSDKCSDQGCSCYCIVGARKDGICTRPYVNRHYDMYRFNGKLMDQLRFSLDTLAPRFLLTIYIFIELR